MKGQREHSVLFNTATTTAIPEEIIPKLELKDPKIDRVIENASYSVSAK
jgi:hypothetical protein